MADIETFISQYYEWLIGISVILFITTMILVPALVIRLPEDYFCHQHRHPVSAQHPLVKLFISLLRNSLGLILVVSGLIMLFTPGQGLLTLLAGLMVMNYPGKYALERWLIIRLRLLPALNWLRRHYGTRPLAPPPHHASDQSD